MEPLGKYMKKILWCGMIAVMVLGTLWHFGYEVLGETRIAGYIFPVNESTWEHMKLAFYPMLLFHFVLCSVEDRKYKSVEFASLAGIFTATWLIPVLFFTYRGCLGFGKSFIDISIFYISVALAFGLISHILKAGREKAYNILTWIMYVWVVLQTVSFIFFTYHPGALQIFAEPGDATPM